MTLELTINLLVVGGCLLGALVWAIRWTRRLRSLRWYQAVGVLGFDGLFVVAAIRVGVAYLSH